MSNFYSVLLSVVIASASFIIAYTDHANEDDGTNMTLKQLLVRVETPRLHRYDGAPMTPDANDPAIWIHPKNTSKSLVIGTLKNAGLQVYDLQGNIVQTINPPNQPPVSVEDPLVPGLIIPSLEKKPCPESESEETFGRFNNVAVLHGFPLHGASHQVDLAIVTDHGCDRLRSYVIDPSDPFGPLRDITDPYAERIFDNRFVQPSKTQPATNPLPGIVPNPLDDQDTAYGLAVWKDSWGRARAFVSQRNRSRIVELLIYETSYGKVGYQVIRDFRFPVRHSVHDLENDFLTWEPCRQKPNEDPHFEGLSVDQKRGILYAGQEIVGVWKLLLSPFIPKHKRVLNIPRIRLIEPVKTFGKPFVATPSGDTFVCKYKLSGDVPTDAIVGRGNQKEGGRYLGANVDAISVIETGLYGGLVVASSQGDNTLHAFRGNGGFTRQYANQHLGAFTVNGIGNTQGLSGTAQSLGSNFPFGILVVHNGEAVEPPDIDPVNGFEYNGSTQFKFINWGNIIQALDD